MPLTQENQQLRAIEWPLQLGAGITAPHNRNPRAVVFQQPIIIGNVDDITLPGKQGMWHGRHQQCLGQLTKAARGCRVEFELRIAHAGSPESKSPASAGLGSTIVVNNGGEGGVRTLDTLLTYTHFPGVLLQPLGHLTGFHQTRS